jgi:hypothetical protein
MLSGSRKRTTEPIHAREYEVPIEAPRGAEMEAWGIEPARRSHRCAESGLVTDRATFDPEGAPREGLAQHLQRRAESLFEQIVSDSMH